MGALRFRADDAGPFLDNNQHHAAPPVTSLRELGAASLALEQDAALENDSISEWLTALLAPGSSLGGARPKANFTDTDGSAWIAKFPSREDRRDMGGWEMLIHQLADAAKVDVSPARLLRLGSRYRTFATKRFDRVARRRRFFVSALTLLGKQDGQGGSYLELAEFLSTRGSTAHRASDLRQLWTRVVFNILVSNTDDHLRNHGFILESDGWRLAPAYDMNPNMDKRAHTLAIDTHDNTSDIGLALATAEFYGLKPAQAREIADATKQVVSTWRDVAISLKLPRVESEQLAAAFKI
jgi:serine/threonine-protein kinase HipA